MLLLVYSVNTQALSSLSATTAQVINGSEPYLTFDGGVTKLTDTEYLFRIILSDGTIITPANNTSPSTLIELPDIDQTFADVDMFVPTTANSIALNTIIGEPNNYWGDDDGDGQGSNGITVNGDLSVSIYNKLGQAIGRSDALDICYAPYRIVLTLTDGSLITQYGVPNSRSFTNRSVTYYIVPKVEYKICVASPRDTESSDYLAGPADIWRQKLGFFVQSTNPATYDHNFPTTGYFYSQFQILISGDTLTWPSVTKSGITATMHSTTDKIFNNVTVTLSGPHASQINLPSLPQTFELVGYDSNNRAVVKYGFVLKQWFIPHNEYDTVSNHAAWCDSLGYRLVQVKDLTNAKDVQGWGFEEATPISTMNNYQRQIGAGLFSEWGAVYKYNPDFNQRIYLTSDTTNGTYVLGVNSEEGEVIRINNPISKALGVCVYP